MVVGFTMKLSGTTVMDEAVFTSKDYSENSCQKKTFNSKTSKEAQTFSDTGIISYELEMTKANSGHNPHLEAGDMRSSLSDDSDESRHRHH